MFASRAQTHACDDSLRSPSGTRRPNRRVSKGFLELSPAVPLQDRVITLVAVLVALVHHHQSYSVTLGNRMGMFRFPHQMRRSLRWRMIERD
jgi:hypothetical protein